MSQLADDFYLVAHDDRSGRCRIPVRAAALGLAAGLVAELVLGGQVRVVAGRLVPGVADRPPQDRVLRDLAGQVVMTRPTDLAWWLGRTAPAAVELVRYRLVLDGLITRVATRSLGRRRVAWVPIDPNRAVWPSVRLAKGLSERRDLTVEDRVLTGLVEVTGLLGTVLWCKPDHTPGYPQAARVRRELAADMGGQPGGELGEQLAEVLAYADAAIGSGVLAGRGS